MGWTGPWQGAVSNTQTNERTSFPAENLPRPGRVKSFHCLKLSLLHPLIFQEFPFVSKSSNRNTNLMDINICAGFFGWETYQHRQPPLLEIVLTLTTQQNPQSYLLMERSSRDRISSAVFIVHLFKLKRSAFSGEGSVQMSPLCLVVLSVDLFQADAFDSSPVKSSPKFIVAVNCPSFSSANVFTLTEEK